MKYLIIAFISRNNLMAFNKILQSHQILTKIVNTPHKISSSCSLSIKAEFPYQSNILNLVKQTKLDGFLGMYLVNEFNGFTQVNKIL